MLEDEVKDLRLCLRSADKELAESKAELVKEQKASSKRSSKLYQQVSDQITSSLLPEVSVCIPHCVGC